jgi:hypothetical protein
MTTNYTLTCCRSRKKAFIYPFLRKRGGRGGESYNVVSLDAGSCFPFLCKIFILSLLLKSFFWDLSKRTAVTIVSSYGTTTMYVAYDVILSFPSLVFLLFAHISSLHRNATPERETEKE